MAKTFEKWTTDTDIQRVIGYRLKKWRGLKTDREELRQELLILLWRKLDDVNAAEESDGGGVRYFSKCAEYRLHDIHRQEHEAGLWMQASSTYRNGTSRIEKAADGTIAFLHDPWLEKRRAKARESRRQWWQTATEEEKETRRQRVRDWRRRREAAETPEERESRLAKKREYRRQKLAAETPEEREIRLAKIREYAKQKRIAGAEERLARKEKAHEERLAYMEATKQQREEEQRRKRVEYNARTDVKARRAEYYRMKRAAETPKQREARLAKRRKGGQECTKK